MFVFTFKASTLKYFGVMSLCVTAIVLTVVLVPSKSIYSGSDGAVIEVYAERKKGDMSNVAANEDRIAFLESYGWSVESQPISQTEVVIPREFDEVYSEYNGLQKKQGLNLEKYRGKSVMLYTYKVTNAEDDAYANLLIYKNRVIGGDVSSASPDGFVYGFDGK